MHRLLQDLRYALRQLRKNPGFTSVAVITLALGIGANTAIFTLVHAVLLTSLPVAEPGQLYRIGDTDRCCVLGGFLGNGDFDMFSHTLYLHVRDSAPEFESLAAMPSFGAVQFNVRRSNGVAKTLRAEYVSGNYFSTLGVGASAGRSLANTDDVSGAPPVAVLSDQAWRADYNSDPTVLGSTFYIKTQPVTIVGIVPPRFFGDRVAANSPSLWIPLADEPLIERGNSILRDPGAAWLYAVGRVRPGTDLVALQGKLSATLRQWLATQPQYTRDGGDSQIPKQHVVLTPAGGGIQNLQQQTGDGLRLLMIISGLALLIACANIANLLLARGISRRSEISLRMALGSARICLVRQMLTESVLLGCLGGLAGLAVAYLGTRTILSLAFPGADTLPIQASPSLPVLGFAFVLSMITGIVFGVAPAWFNSHSEPAEALRGLNRTTHGRSSFPQKSLIVLQTALALVLLAGAGLLTESLRNLEKQNLGLSTENRYVVHLDPAGAGYTAQRLPTLYQQIEQRLTSTAGVRSVGLALFSPLEGGTWGDCVFVEGRPAPGPNDNCGSAWDRVSPQVFQAVGQPVIRGRGITEQDTPTSRFVAVVNQAFVKKFFPREDPVGKHFGTIGKAYAGNFEIVGVVADAKYSNPRGEFGPMFFRALTQQITTYKEASALTGETRSMFIDSVTLNFGDRQQNADSLVRHVLASIDPNLPIADFQSLNDQVAGNFNQERLIARLTMLFSLLALALASVGLYGVTAYAVGRRTSEIGVRMALGATQASVVTMVLRTAFLQIIVGLALGVPAALLGGSLLKHQLYGIHFTNLPVLSIAIVILAGSAAVAGLIPARRAARVDPMIALRYE